MPALFTLSLPHASFPSLVRSAGGVATALVLCCAVLVLPAGATAQETVAGNVPAAADRLSSTSSGGGDPASDMPVRQAPGRLSRLGSSGPVGLARLLEATVSVHPSVRARQGELQAAGFDLDGANWARYPSLSSEVQADDGSKAAALQLQQPLWTGGRIPGQIDLATANREAASAAVIEAEQQVMLSVGTSFYEFIRQQARIEIARSNEAEHTRLLEMIQRRVRAEVSPEADEVLAAARTQQAVAERLQFERALETARVSLEQISAISLAGGLRSPERLPPLPASELEALDAAIEFSAERRRLQALVVASRAQIDVTRAGTRPTVYAAVRQQVGPLQFGQDRTRAFVGVEFKPGPGLSSLTAVQAAASRLEANEESVVVHERQLSQQVRAAWLDYQSQTIQLGPSRAIAGSTDEVVASYLRQYQVGRKTWLDVLNAQRETTAARYTVADLEAGILSAHLRLLMLSGRVDARSLSRLGP